MKVKKVKKSQKRKKKKEKRMDDSLENVLNIKTTTGRTLTPQLKRNITPQKNISLISTTTTIRSNSAPKKLNFNNFIYESQLCNQKLKVNVSKRTKQRWENDNLFGLRVFMNKKFNNNGNNNSNNNNNSNSNEGDEDEIEWKESGIEINWQSMFSELLLEENAALLKSYLACTSSFTPSTTQQQHRSKTLEDCISEWEKAEFSWIKVEKKLRNVITTSIVRHPNARAFVLLIEDLLLEMDDHLEKIRQNNTTNNTNTSTKTTNQRKKEITPFIYSIPNEMEHLFARPIKFVTTSKTSFFQITLTNSSYHRLLLHATCQFHGRTSKVNFFS